MGLLSLLKKLVSIPSYLGQNTNEKEIGEFIISYLRKIPFIKRIEKEKVEGERFNIFASDGFSPRLLLLGHLDTVEPRGWKASQALQPKVKGKKLFGLGSYDMKGGISAILASLSSFKETQGLSLLFYCDEEYDFKGMKRFTRKRNFSAKLAVCGEPTDLKIWNGARGIIKVSFIVEGKTAPASVPKKGKNAILGLLKGVLNLEKEIKKFKEKNLGFSTVNLSAIKGGVKKEGFIEERGDAVADIAWGLLDIRSASKKLDSKIIKKILFDFFKKEGLKMSKFSVYHDLKPFYTRKNEIKKALFLIKKVLGKVEYLNLKEMGYQDIQLLNEKFKIPCFSFGPKGGKRHQEGEWVDIPSLFKVKKVYEALIRKFCQVL